MKTFARGIGNLKHRKGATEASPLVEMPAPKRIVLPMMQNLGVPAEPIVKVGDEVVEGQKVADSSKFVSAPIHASIAGKVTKIEKLTHPTSRLLPTTSARPYAKPASSVWGALPSPPT
ncbi:MAG: Electron transport complex protein RnfC [Syntrophaceae bacterium PtaU1.Bin231]|nr:MAG: Electron transport complex protein RnfC [Syntrophaceae bacterium PtaU1.Bin231]